MDSRPSQLRERGLLVPELSVLQRLIAMDRLRALAIAITALKGRLRNARAALMAYIEQSPLRQSVPAQMAEISQSNLVAVARREAETMVKTVEILLADTLESSTGMDEIVHLEPLVRHLVADHAQAFAEEDIKLALQPTAPSLSLKTDRGLLRQLLAILLRRIADMHEERMSIILHFESRDESSVAISLRGNRSHWSEAQVASLFSAAIPLQRWPMGLDMDLLSAFLIVHHLGGRLEIHATPPEGPGFRVLITVAGGSEEQPVTEQEWFDRVFKSVQEWERLLGAESEVGDQKSEVRG